MIRPLVVHEPPAVTLLDGKREFADALAGFDARIQPVAELLWKDRWEDAAKLFANTVAVGPEAWETSMTRFPRDVRPQCANVLGRAA